MSQSTPTRQTSRIAYIVLGLFTAFIGYTLISASFDPFSRPTVINTQLQACLDAIPANTPPGSSKAYCSNCRSKYGE